MDFHSLSRRELQALCKRNKIPANITNLAMADALKALDLVEGMEEFLEQSQSETAQSSIESPVRSEAASLYVPPTGGRSTRQRNVAKEEPETANPMTRTRRTTRKTVAKDADELQASAVQTPAVVGQTNRNKSLMASACLKMDSQLKECVEEEKKDALMTPAHFGVTSRRRRGVKEETAVTRVYSTRRSTRLAEKTEVENGQSGLFKTDLLTKDGENMKMNLKDDLDEILEISEADASTTVEEESSDKRDELGHVSVGNEKEVVRPIEEEMGHHFEADASKQEMESSDVEFEAVGFTDGKEADLKEEICDKIEESKDEKLEIAAENTEELNSDKDADDVENVVPASEDNNAVDELVCDPDICNEIEKEMHNDNDMDSEDVSDFNVNEEVQEINTEVHMDVVEKEFNLDHDGKPLDSIIVEAKEESTDMVVEENEKSLQLNKEKHEETEIVLHEESTKADMGSSLVFQPTRLMTPIKNSASKTLSATAKRMSVIVSDNKENIGSGGKLLLTKERVKIVKNTAENVSKLDDLSVRKLTKMLKEKLQITNNSSKNENDDEIISHEQVPVVARPALQAIPENR
ncbi:hypothetical protein BUALT_Bualt06G0143800 [Buddleja alternifolia]|uniref:Uncharacterized protein n=1 Tax=Buddleja alternifolia TaxID=168488 RepID=A0AAV6XN23_9LAMI|nr:hypothetical protein BUALT_Bualt06G0143800 [Buddleja alternifolia]